MDRAAWVIGLGIFSGSLQRAGGGRCVADLVIRSLAVFEATRVAAVQGDKYFPPEHDGDEFRLRLRESGGRV